MPIYEYTCTACGASFDYFARRLSDKPETCPQCGAAALKKNLSAFSTTTSTARPAVPSCPTGTCCPGGTCSLN